VELTRSEGRDDPASHSDADLPSESPRPSEEGLDRTGLPTRST
jgi:hypothetical protein